MCVHVRVCDILLMFCLLQMKAPPSKPKGNTYADKLKYDHQMLLYQKEHAKWLHDTQTLSQVGCMCRSHDGTHTHTHTHTRTHAHTHTHTPGYPTNPISCRKPLTSSTRCCCSLHMGGWWTTPQVHLKWAGPEGWKK